MKYACIFIHPKTGERREVVVTLDDLTANEREFLEHNRITRPGAGAPGGPIEMAYVLKRANNGVPLEWRETMPEIRRVH
jgi:hypothetical protein